MLIDLLAVLPIAVLTALVLASLVCIVALFRAERAHTVAVLKALPEAVAALLRFRRQR
ncbi:hypothetical protein [Streptomyces sp. ODS05-4]|uniref:hypothetical protein n=1 Tax=Streptomyces sp. ODS05-4 TaxID=2944939 RepID=UPI00210EE220|nr:hypothetical protein [Streptomyces sp. ODS05-4]